MFYTKLLPLSFLIEQFVSSIYPETFSTGFLIKKRDVVPGYLSSLIQGVLHIYYLF